MHCAKEKCAVSESGPIVNIAQLHNCCCVKQLGESLRKEVNTVELQITQLRGSWFGLEMS